LTGSSGLIFFYIKKSKQRRFSKVFDWVLPGHTEFFLPLFFLQSGPVPALDWSVPG